MTDAAIAVKPQPKDRAGDGAAILALVLALVAFAFLLLASANRLCSSFGGEEVCVIRWDDILASLVLSAPPVIASGIPVVFLRSPRSIALRTAAAVILCLIAIVGFMLAPGLLFLPSAVAMSVSAVQARVPSRTHRSAARVLAAVSLALAFAAAAGLLFVSSGERCVSRAGSGQPESTVCSSTTLLDSEGPSVIGILIIPVVIAAVPVLAGRHRIARALRAICAAVLLAMLLLGLFSIGLYFVPSMLAMVVGAALDDPQAN